MVEIIPPTEKAAQDYQKERSSLLRSPLLYSLRTIAEILVTGKEPKITRVSRGLRSAMYVDSVQSSMLNITPRTDE